MSTARGLAAEEDLRVLEGGCFCGAVRYTVTGEPYGATLCYCADCRRVAGAPAVAWFTVGTAEVRFAGREAARFASSPTVVRTFCPTCGTGLSYANADTPAEIDIATATLDEPDRVPPKDHVWMSERVDWMVIGDGLPRYAKGRADG